MRAEPGAGFSVTNLSTMRSVPVLVLLALMCPSWARELAAVGSHPYSVSVQREGRHICNGALISDRLVITAAHCVVAGQGIESYPPRNFYVRAGSIQRLVGGQLAQLSRIAIHPEYDAGVNDLALLELQSPLTLNDLTQPIELATETPAVGAEITYTGWGSSVINGTPSQRLQVGTRQVISPTDCYAETYFEQKGLLCLKPAKEATATEGLCTGDAGAPAVYNNKLVGSGVFFHNDCGTPEADGYVDLSHYLDWINEHS